MKKVLIPLLVALLAAIAIWCVVRHGQQQAVMAVLNQANKATVQTRHLANGRTVVVHPNSPLFSKREFVVSLERISTTGCPKTFQFAWLDFTQTFERSQEPFAGLGAVGEYVVSGITPWGTGTKDALQRLDKLNAPEAWRRVQRVALEYDVQLVQQ
jgi:hypothetical protein